jgi:HAMP domain-containing protein
LGASDVMVWGAQGRLVGGAGESRFDITPQRPASDLLRRVREARGLVWVEGLEEDLGGASNASVAALRIWVPLVSTSIALSEESRYLEVKVVLPASLVQDALAVQTVNREYQERALARSGLQRMYIGTLTLTLFLSVFGAVLLAVLMGNQLMKPLLMLADGMREVAAGDLSPKRALPPRDELSSLTHTFAGMTADLAQARAMAQHSLGELDAARASLQTILDNLSAGVLVLDAGRGGAFARVCHGLVGPVRRGSIGRWCDAQPLADHAGVGPTGRYRWGPPTDTACAGRTSARRPTLGGA